MMWVCLRSPELKQTHKNLQKARCRIGMTSETQTHSSNKYALEHIKLLKHLTFKYSCVLSNMTFIGSGYLITQTQDFLVSG